MRWVVGREVEWLRGDVLVYQHLMRVVRVPGRSCEVRIVRFVVLMCQGSQQRLACSRLLVAAKKGM